MNAQALVLVGCVACGAFYIGCGEPQLFGQEIFEDAPPMAERRPKLMDPDRVPDTIPSGQDPDLNGLALIAGCGESPHAMTVAKKHHEPSPCEHIVVDAAESTEIQWFVADPKVAKLFFPTGSNGVKADPAGLADVFDLDDDSADAVTTVWACAMQTERCATVEVTSVVNLEDLWLLSGTTFKGDQPAVFEQDGANFKDDSSGVKRGYVHGEAVNFEIDDYLYDGVISPNRKHMKGEVREALTLQVVGIWKADRVLP